MPVIETSRLILREFNVEDDRELSPILANPQVMQFSLTGCLTVAQTQAKIDDFITSYRQYGFGKWAVILKKENRLIGYCGIAIKIIDDRPETELGYRLDERYWGQGLATEAAQAALQYGLDQLELPYILAIVEPANQASVRVIEKLGMKYHKKTVFQGLQVNVYRMSADKSR
jgi:[ribosomal protein S5]-alanine N-acetyltransferase